MDHTSIDRQCLGDSINTSASWVTGSRKVNGTSFAASCLCKARPGGENVNTPFGPKASELNTRHTASRTACTEVPVLEPPCCFQLLHLVP